MSVADLRTVVCGVALLLTIGCASRGEADGNYSLQVEAPRQVAVGQTAKALVRVVPKGQWKVNLQYPLKLRLKPVDGVDLPKTDFGAADGRLTEKEVRIEVPFVAKTAGAKTVSGELKFSLCVADKCDIKKEPVQWTVSCR